VSAVDARSEVRCWRALAAAALLGTLLLGCGGGDEEPAHVAPAPGMSPVAAGARAQPLPAEAAVAAPPRQLAAQASVTAAPCDRATLAPHGAQAALHAERLATEGEFAALAETGRRQHAGTVPADDPMADPAPTR
jgi:hypothetical protein